MPKYKFDRRRQEYTTATGKPIKSTTVRKWVDQAVDGSKGTVTGLAERFNKGEIDLAEFVTSTKAELKRMHVGVAAIAAGGKGQLDSKRLGRLGSQVREQYKYLERLALQVEAGEQKPDGSLVSRIGMYSDAGIHTYERVRQLGYREAGFSEERNVLGANNSCGECPEETSRGWQPIGSLKPTGTRACLSRCRCHLEYR